MITGEWLEWGQWSECSQICGGGEKIRSRKCHYDTVHGIEGHSAPCKGAQSDSTECNQHPCTRVGPGEPLVLSSWCHFFGKMYASLEGLYYKVNSGYLGHR